jgi:hypothetical protein
MSLAASDCLWQLLDTVLLSCSLHGDDHPSTAWIRQATPSCFLIYGGPSSGKSSVLDAIQQAANTWLPEVVQVSRESVSAYQSAEMADLPVQGIRWLHCPQHVAQGQAYTSMLSAHAWLRRVQQKFILGRKDRQDVLLLLDDVDMLLEHSVDGTAQATSLLQLLDLWCCEGCTAFCQCLPTGDCASCGNQCTHMSDHQSIDGVSANVHTCNEVVTALLLPSVTLVLTCSDLSLLPANFKIAGGHHVLQLHPEALGCITGASRSCFPDDTLRLPELGSPRAFRNAFSAGMRDFHSSKLQDGTLTIDCVISLQQYPHADLPFEGTHSAGIPWEGMYGYNSLKTNLQAYAVEPFLASILPTATRNTALLAARLRWQGVLPPRGCVLYGPTGCGKTSFAKGIGEACGLRSMVIQVRCRGL